MIGEEIQTQIASEKEMLKRCIVLLLKVGMHSKLCSTYFFFQTFYYGSLEDSEYSFAFSLAEEDKVS